MAKQRKKYGERAASIRLDEEIYAQIERVRKVINASPTSKGNVTAKSTTALRHSIIIGLSVIEMMGDGYQSPQHTIDAIRAQMVIN